MDQKDPKVVPPVFIPPACAYSGPLRSESPLEKLFSRKKSKDKPGNDASTQEKDQGGIR